MSRVQVLGACAVLALAYTAANAVDAALADLPRLTRMIHAGEILIGLPALMIVVLLNFGGLPLAVFGLLYERQWASLPMERRRFLRVPYSVLMFQIVSMVISGFWLLLMGPGLLWAVRYGMFGVPMIPAYFGVQMLASLAAIPIWRRLVMNASGSPTGSVLRL